MESLIGSGLIILSVLMAGEATRIKPIGWKVVFELVVATMLLIGLSLRS